jgi:hypothetical protein
MVAPGRVELPTFGLGNRCSIHLSYGAKFSNLASSTTVYNSDVRRLERPLCTFIAHKMPDCFVSYSNLPIAHSL